MDEEDALQIMLISQARSDMQRVFLKMLLRRLTKDVPDFSLELLSEQLHIFLQHAPQPGTAPNPRQALMAATGQEELRDLIDMVEEVIKDALQPDENS